MWVAYCSEQIKSNFWFCVTIVIIVQSILLALFVMRSQVVSVSKNLLQNRSNYSYMYFALLSSGIVYRFVQVDFTYYYRYRLRTFYKK